MVEDDIKLNAGMDGDDDTKTRKTVRLKPSEVTPGSIKLPTPGTPIAASTANQASGSGKTGLEDTQTRRTIKLKPLSQAPGGPQPIKIDTISNTPATPKMPEKPAADGENTQTRKTVVLRPSAVTPASVKLPGSDANSAENTQTRKTVVLRPSAVTPASVKINNQQPAPAAPEATAPKTFPTPMTPKEDAQNDETIRITRPNKNKEAAGPNATPATPLGQPVPTLSLNKNEKPAPAPSAPTPAAKEDNLATIKLAPTNKPANTPPAPPAGLNLKRDEEKPAALNLAKGSDTKEPEAKEEKKAEPAPQAAPKPTPMPYGKTSRPSVAYLVLAALSFVLLAATTAITTVEYLNICQNQNIELPGLTKTK